MFNKVLSQVAKTENILAMIGGILIMLSATNMDTWTFKKPANLIMPLVLIMVLTPGFLLTLPPGDGSIFKSKNSSLLAMAVHSIVFIVLYSFLKINPATKKYY